MLKVLRKFRKNLFNGNKFINYILYGIGEITLVVIGILVAVQINNWNDQTKTSDQAEKYIEALKKDVAQNIKACEYYLESFNERFDNTKAYIDLLIYENSDSISDSSIVAMYSTLGPINKFDLISTSYDEIRFSNGLQTINNDSLKAMIISFGSLITNHSNYYNEYKIYADKLVEYSINNANLIYTEDSLKVEDISENKLAVNRAAYIDNQQYLNLLISTKGSIFHFINMYQYELKFFKEFERILNK